MASDCYDAELTDRDCCPKRLRQTGTDTIDGCCIASHLRHRPNGFHLGNGLALIGKRSSPLNPPFPLNLRDPSLMAKIFCIANQKGGVGKTTTSVNLAAGLARLGQRVLLIDLDPQGNATMGSNVDKRQLAHSVYDVLLEQASIAQASVAADKCGYRLLGANRELAGAEVELVDQDRRETRLKEALAKVDGDYDFVLIDCPPALSLLTLNGLCAAHGVIVPMQCEYFALEGLTDLVNTIKQVHANLNPQLKVIGLLRVMFDPRITLQQQVSEQLKNHFGDKVFNTVIPRNVRLAEAPSYALPGVVFDPNAKGSKAFIEFAAEMVERIKSL